jgi:hypothetical protein
MNIIKVSEQGTTFISLDTSFINRVTVPTGSHKSTNCLHCTSDTHHTSTELYV